MRTSGRERGSGGGNGFRCILCTLFLAGLKARGWGLRGRRPGLAVGRWVRERSRGSGQGGCEVEDAWGMGTDDDAWCDEYLFAYSSLPVGALSNGERTLCQCCFHHEAHFCGRRHWASEDPVSWRKLLLLLLRLRSMRIYQNSRSPPTVVGFFHVSVSCEAVDLVDVLGDQRIGLFRFLCMNYTFLRKRIVSDSDGLHIGVIGSVDVSMSVHAELALSFLDPFWRKS